MSSTATTVQVIEFVRALALTWKNLAAYPATHPAVVNSLELVRNRLDELRGPAGEVVLGISSDGLMYGGSKIEVTAAQKFAQALFTRGVALLRLANDTNSHDIEIFLRLLAAGAPGETKRAIWDDLTAAGVMSINLQPVDYSAVRVTDTLEEQKGKERPESLWDEILRALLENRFFSSRLPHVPKHIESADELARMISQYVDVAASTSTAWDPDATFGVRVPNREDRENVYRFLQKTIGNYITEATGLKKQHSLEQAIQLLRSLADPLRGTVLRAVAEALATDDAAEGLLREFASELPRDEVLDALRYLSAMGKLSKHAMMLLDSLMRVEAATRSAPPSEAIVNDLVSLFREEDVDRFNPEDHQALLKAVAVHIPKVPPDAGSSMVPVGDRGGTVDPAAITEQLAFVLFDLIAELGSSRDPKAVLMRLETALRAHMSAGDFGASLAIVEHLQTLAKTASPELRAAIEDTLARLTSGETIKALVDMVQKATPEKMHEIQRLAIALGATARKNLLTALADENNRSRRRRLFDFIQSLGADIVPDVIAFLDDERWFVARNMIALLRAVGDRTSLPQMQKLARHPDLRVRMEAIKSLLALDSAVSRTLLDDVLNDKDPKVAEMAIGLVGNYGIKEGVDPLLRIVSGMNVMGGRRTLRIKAIRALGEIGDPGALGGLEHFFKSGFLPWPSKDERYTAWESLYNYPPDARNPLIERGLRSSDPKVRAICEKFAGSS